MLLARTALRARPMRGVRARALGDLCTDMGLVKKYGIPQCFGNRCVGMI